MNAGAGWLASFASGTIIWLIATLLSGGREPWDTGDYWLIYLPAAYVLCGILGYTFPRRTWRWPMMVMLAQLPVMVIVTGSGLGLLPLGIIFLLILSVPGMAAAALGGTLYRRAQGEASS
ncbi:MAG TPA: hypothetical protein VFK19_05320 [Sphingomicrobium sp.]|nr:hypothetical protein [Sphingomicrobium sp.]